MVSYGVIVNHQEARYLRHPLLKHSQILYIFSEVLLIFLEHTLIRPWCLLFSQNMDTGMNSICGELAVLNNS